jgi:pyruvate dehydrogenase E1 component beta subunit
VVFLEPKRIYRSLREPVADDGVPVPPGRAYVLRAGTDVTLISWGAMLVETLAAAEALAAAGVRAEVIDVATLKPLDEDTLLDSVRRTGRAVIVHEAARTGGFGAEIAARIAEQALFALKAPVLRVTGWDTVMPLPRLEHRYMPTTAEVVAAARRLMAYD